VLHFRTRGTTPRHAFVTLPELGVAGSIPAGALRSSCSGPCPVVRTCTHDFRSGSSAAILPTRLGSTLRDAHTRDVTDASPETLRRLSQSAYPCRPNLMVESCAEAGSCAGPYAVCRILVGHAREAGIVPRRFEHEFVSVRLRAYPARSARTDTPVDTSRMRPLPDSHVAWLRGNRLVTTPLDPRTPRTHSPSGIGP